MQEFFFLGTDKNLPDKYFAQVTLYDLESVKCLKFKGHQRPGRRLNRNLSVIIPNNPHDIIPTWYSERLINEKVVSLLKDKRVSGYRLEDVIIVKDRRKGDSLNRKLYELIPVGDGGSIHPSSGYRLLDVCPYCGKKKIQPCINGLMVDESAWDGSDIFTLREYPKLILITQKVKDLFEKNKITGCTILPAEQKKINYDYREKRRAQLGQ